MNLNEAYELYHDDPAANAEVFGEALLRYCQANSRDEDDASDAVLKVWENLANYKPNATFTTWVRNVLHNQIVDRQRKTNREVPLEEANTMTHDGGLFDVEDRIAARQALQSLSKADRDFVKLKMEGWSEAEIDKKYNKKLGWANDKWGYLKEKLRILVS